MARVLALLLRQPRGRLPRRLPAAHSRPSAARGLGVPALGAVGAGGRRPGAPLCGGGPPGRAAGAPARRGPARARPAGGAESGGRGGRGVAGGPGRRRRRAGDAAGAPQARPQVCLAVVQEHEAALGQQRQHLLAAQALLEGLECQVWGGVGGEPGLGGGGVGGREGRAPSLPGIAFPGLEFTGRGGVRGGTGVGVRCGRASPWLGGGGMSQKVGLPCSLSGAGELGLWMSELGERVGRQSGRFEGPGGWVAASPRVSMTTPGITSLRTSQLVCRAGLEFISSSHTWANTAQHASPPTTWPAGG